MSGTQERLRYDPGAYAAELRESTAPILWMLDPTQVRHCQPCRPAEPGYIGTQGVSLSYQQHLVDVESELRGQNYRLTRDPTQKFTPYCPKCQNRHEGYPCGGGVVQGHDNCQESLHHFKPWPITTSHSRLDQPRCTLREIGINRFHPLQRDPQAACRWQNPSEVNINYRIVAKDNHRPCLPVIRPEDPWPQPGKVPCQVYQGCNPSYT